MAERGAARAGVPATAGRRRWRPARPPLPPRPSKTAALACGVTDPGSPPLASATGQLRALRPAGSGVVAPRSVSRCQGWVPGRAAVPQCSPAPPGSGSCGCSPAGSRAERAGLPAGDDGAAQFPVTRAQPAQDDGQAGRRGAVVGTSQQRGQVDGVPRSVEAAIGPRGHSRCGDVQVGRALGVAPWLEVEFGQLENAGVPFVSST
jgi:hypothetical protein